MILQPEIKIKKIRELKNVSQEFVANKLGLSIRAYSKIETGETQLTINRLNEISDALGVNPIEVLGFDDKQVFNNCKQEGNFGNGSGNVFNALPEKLIQQYEKTINYNYRCFFCIHIIWTNFGEYCWRECFKHFWFCELFHRTGSVSKYE